MNESHAKKTVVGLPGPAVRPTVPGTDGPVGRVATEVDYRNERDARAGTRMAGMDALQEPNASDNRVRLSAGRLVPGTRYRLKRWLGEGGMGVVYEAEHIDIERKAALKILRFDLSQEERMTQVFRDEARTASRIGNENIVEIFDFGELPDGRLFFCMELVEGTDLVPASDDDWIEPSRLIGLMRQICKGLHAAHTAGIVHRDVKPENVLIVEKDGRPDVVKIVDFGISAMLAAGQDSGAIAGTPHYMAPEQIRGEAFDGRLDIYSLGCMAYELLVGWPPFLGDELEELLRQHLQDTPKPIREVRPERNIPAELEAVILKCLQKNPAHRFQDMADLEAALCEAQVAAKLVTAFDDLPLPDGPSIAPERRERLLRDMPTPPNALVIEQKRKWIWPVVAGVSAIAATVAVVLALRGPAPTDEDQALVDQLTAEANEAGALTHYVYPPAQDVEAPTTFIKVKELEGLEGSADDLGEDRADELRGTYAQTLVSLGDRYWGDDATRRVARDYYFQSLLFDPDNDTAFERAGNPSPGELAEWRDKAANGRFTSEELRNGILLNALATDDKTEAQEKLDTYVAMGADDEDSIMREQSVLTAARGAGLDVKRSKTKRSQPDAETGDGDEDGDLVVDGEEDGVGEEGGESDLDGDGDVPPPPKKGIKKRNKTSDENLAKAQRDPDKAADLADEGAKALSNGQRKNAESLFHQAVGYDRRNAKALMGLSDVYFDTGSNQKAVLYAERAVKAAPKNQSYRLKLGDAYFKVLRYRDALTQYEKAKNLGSSKADARIAKVKPKVGG